MLRAIYRSLGGSRSARSPTTEQGNVTHVYSNDSDSDIDDTSTVTPSAPPLSAHSTQRRRLTRAEAMERLRELLECSICLEELDDPRVLPCHHSFCLPCLQKIHLGGNRVFRCPNCNKEVQLRRGVTELPTDFRANALRECLPEEDVDEVVCGGTGNAATSAALPAFNTSNTVMGMVTCPVCEEILTEPRCLDCGHSFCLGCLEFMMPMSGSTIHCPCCASQTVVQNGVDALPVDAAKSHMMEMFSAPSAPPDTSSPAPPPTPSLYPDLSDQTIPGYNEEPTSLLPPPQSNNNDNADRPQDIGSIILNCLRDIRSQLHIFDAAIVRMNTMNVNTLSYLCLMCFFGGVMVASVDWESGMLKLVVSVLTFFGPLFVLVGVLVLVFGLCNATVRDVGVHERQMYGGWIGGIVGAEVFVYYSATSTQGLFCAVSGSVFGCVAVCMSAMSSPGHQHTTLSSRGFIEGLAWKTLPFVMLGGVYGTGIIESILFVPTASVGAIIGMLVSSRILAFFAKNNVWIKLSKYNIFTTLRGAVLGNITSAVLLRLLHPRFGVGRCLISGAALGAGIGLIVGDIYMPWLRKLLRLPADNGVVGPASHEGSWTQRRVVLALGTLTGGILGFVTTLQIFGVLIGALLGLYLAEQGMDSFRLILNDVLKLYDHCAVGGLVGACVGFLVALSYNSPLCGPLLGVVMETAILELYMQDHVRDEH